MKTTELNSDEQKNVTGGNNSGGENGNSGSLLGLGILDNILGGDSNSGSGSNDNSSHNTQDNSGSNGNDRNNNGGILGGVL